VTLLDHLSENSVAPIFPMVELLKAQQMKCSCRSIVIKTTDGYQDTLIGKLSRTQNLIVHIISKNITEIVEPSIREWKYTSFTQILKVISYFSVFFVL
jgi:vacuolar-type H+-ATPase subunit C/Vma6